MGKLSKPAKWSELEKCTREGYALTMQGLAAIVRVAQSENLKLSLEAGQWLVGYGEDLLRQKALAKGAEIDLRQNGKHGPTATRESILRDLKGLYAKALGEAPLVVEVQPEPNSDK